MALFQPPGDCPVCGAAVPPRAHSCPECGADERSGWDDEATRYDGLDLPGLDDDDDTARPRVSGEGQQRGLGWIAAFLIVALALWLIL